MLSPAASRVRGFFKWFRAAFVAAYFLWVASPSLRARFSADDMMNMWMYWHMGWWKIAWSNLLFFTTAYRPMGGVFYMPIFHFARFHPLPYHIALDAMLAANTYFLYRFAWLLDVPRPAAGLATLICCSHAAVFSMYLQPSELYDVLCFFFFFGALIYYLRIRRGGALLTWRQLVIFLALYVCALNSKGMGVTLPGFIGIYELLYHPPASFHPSHILKWIKTEGRPALIGCVLAVAYVLGKMLGPGSLASQPAYHPVFTMTRFLENNAHYLDELFYRAAHPLFSEWGTVILWALLLVWVWLRKAPYARFCWFFIVLAPLPIAFIQNAAIPVCTYRSRVGRFSRAGWPGISQDY